MKFFSVVVLVVCAVWATETAGARPKLFFGHNRVISGEDAKPNQFPHQVSLQVNNRHICGGSILTEKWIVTAAHCIGDYSLTVRAGIIDLWKQGGQNAFVFNTIVHHNYEGGVNPNDIALLEITPPLKFDESVQPIKLPAKNSQPSGVAVLSGWGSTSITVQPNYPPILKTAQLQILTFEDCNNRLIGIMGTSRPLTEESNVCTGPIKSNEGGCSGDSGGPLIQGNELIGIVSWGMVPCGHNKDPSVFTKVSSFVDFIRETTGVSI